MALPVWALKGKQLNQWKKLHGITLYSGQVALVLFCDFGEPVATMFLRPLNLSKEGRVIRGTFRLDDDEMRIHEWVVGRYLGGMASFIVSATPVMMKYLFTHSNSVRWYDVPEREKVKKQLEQNERNTSWQKLESTSQLQEPSGWESICSASSVKENPAPANSLQPSLGPVKQSQPALTE